MLDQITPVEAGAQALDQALYEERRQVELLRQQVYAPADSEPTSWLLEEHISAEEKLARLERAWQEQSPGSDQGLLYDSIRQRGGPLQDKMGKDTTGVEASSFLRLSDLPTGIVHLFDPLDKPLVSVKVSNPG